MIGAASPRVLMFCPEFSPSVGGAQRQAEILTASLIAQGTVVEVLAYQQERDWPLHEVRPDGIVIHRIRFSNLNRRFPRLRNVGLGLASVALMSIHTIWALRSLVNRFDVLHAHNASTPITAFAVRIARRCGMRTVVKAVNIREWFDLKVLRQTLWGKLAVRWLRQDVDRWVAISRAVVEELAESGIPAERIAHIPNGVRLNESPNELPEKAAHFLHLGRLSRTAPRDFTGLVRSFEQVAADVPAAELARVGGGDRFAAIRYLAAASSARSRIHVPGQQSAAPWLSWAHCLVQPSYVEGMSNAILEGMAAGLACVAYDIAPNRETLGDGTAGVLIPVRDHSGLAAALRSLATEPGLARAWGKRARDRAEQNYDIEKIAARILELYGKMLAHPPSDL